MLRASNGFKRRIDEAKMTHSMSLVGRCIDNGPTESFCGALKCEKYYLYKFDTFDELRNTIDEYIELPRTIKRLKSYGL